MSGNGNGKGGKNGSLEIEGSDPQLFYNRELSLLHFHHRVLELARDEGTPLLERLRFLTISNLILDEFFEIRVAGLEEQRALGATRVGPDGLSPNECLAYVRDMVVELVDEQYRELNEVLLPALAQEGVVVHRRDHWTDEQREWIRQHFENEVLPVLTPVGLDPAHPFPQILNKSLNFLVTLSGKDAFGRRSRAAIVQAPRLLPRLIALPDEVAGAPHGFVLLSSVIHANVADLFPGMKVEGFDQFRVTRNSDLWVDEEEVHDLLTALKGELPRRHYGNAVRLEVSDTCSEEMAAFLLEQFELEERQLYRVNGPVNLHRVGALYDLIDRPELKYKPFVPGLPQRAKRETDMFSLLRAKDVLLHHPYQAFAPVLELLRQAADDPDVLAIKQTVYRTGTSSAVASALLRAAERGKEVTAIIELRARFDEAANIHLATQLQEAGAKVAYGVVGFKAHSKMLMVVRREGDGVRRYCHLGTGNYNQSTAKAYTDFGLLTADPKVGEDVHNLFQQLTGLGKVRRLNKLVQTPFDLHRLLLDLIEKEIAEAEAGRPARICAKMNSLVEPEIIQALYRASRSGVRVDLIVRGICCLRPGVPGLSETIRVRSFVGRFLEHHRIYYFHAKGRDLVWCSSADWMPRNFFRRVEVAFPIEGKKLKQRVVHEGLEVFLQQDAGIWEMQADGSYRRLEPGAEDPRTAQQLLLDELGGREF